MHKISYFFIRTLTFPISFLPIPLIHFLGKIIGTLSYYLLSEYRKITLSNLSCANFKNIKSLAKKSFINFAIIILEYPKLHRLKNISSIVHCNNPQIAESLYKSKKGIIFFCGHQANWELFFLDGNLRMEGIAIAKPIKNTFLYQWILSIREKTNGKIISFKNGLKESISALKKGKFLGIVGDQASPDSGYFHPFLSRDAWTSSSFALLSYKTNSPIIVATMKREKNKYFINYSPPLFPNKNNPKEKEVFHLFKTSLAILEESIQKNPDQWLWQHNRWKMQTPKTICKKFRYDSILVIFPEDLHFLKNTKIFRKIYLKEYLSFCIPEKYKDTYPSDEVIYYKTKKDILINNYKHKLVYNFTHFKVKAHFKRKAAIKVHTFKDLQKEALKKNKDVKDISEILQTAICRNYAAK